MLTNATKKQTHNRLGKLRMAACKDADAHLERCVSEKEGGVMKQEFTLVISTG